MLNKISKAILETRLEAEISNLFSNISVKAKSIKETLKKQKSDILIDKPEDGQEEEDLEEEKKQVDDLDPKLSELEIETSQLDKDKPETKEEDALNTTVVSVIKVNQDEDKDAEDKADAQKTKLLDDSVITVEQEDTKATLLERTK